MALPTIMDPTGLRPLLPADLRAQLLALVQASNPGYTINLPGSMIDDLSGTAVAAMVVCDQARVDLVNSITPLGANAFLLNQLGQMLGIPRGQISNTTVPLVFTAMAAPGFPIPPGFTVSDGTNQFVVRDGGVIPTSGISDPLAAIALQAGSFAVPPGTVNQLVTSVPGSISLSVTNPLAGSPGGAAETEEDYRVAVLQAMRATSQGTPSYVKTQIGKVPGVDPRLISMRQLTGQWEIIVGGSGDPYQIGYAILQGLFDIDDLVGSTLGVVGITNANPGVVTTTLNHNYVTGQVVHITGVVGMSGINGVALTITVITPTTFSIGIDTTSSGAYASGGVITPNFRNAVANINDYPDVYTIPFVIPPRQEVAIAVTWNTIQPGFLSAVAVSSVAIPALVGYINSIPAGAPINVFELQAVFQTAVSTVLSPLVLTRMLFAISVNGIGVSPAAGTGIIAGDPESYFGTTTAEITVTQG